MSELDRIVRFAIVAEELSFSRAAERLNVDQPWLSRQIQQLEAQIGFPLFVRNTRHVELTPEGEAAFKPARELVRAAEEARGTLRRLAQERNSVLTLGVSASSFWVPGRRMLLERFNTRYKAVRVEVMSEPSGRLLSRLRSGAIDCAIVLCAPDEKRPNRKLEPVPLYKAPASLLIPKENPLAERPTLTLRDLEGQPLAVNSRALAPDVEDPIYAPFLSAGMSPVLVHEGRAAMHHQARVKRLILVSVGWPESDEGIGEDFAHCTVSDLTQDVEYCLVRRRGEQHRPVNRFWNVGLEVSKELTGQGSSQPPV